MDIDDFDRIIVIGYRDGKTEANLANNYDLTAKVNTVTRLQKIY